MSFSTKEQKPSEQGDQIINYDKSRKKEKQSPLIFSVHI